MKTVIGVDPGGSGGLAVMHRDGSIGLFGFKKEGVGQVMEAALAGVSPDNLVVFFEEVGGYVGVGQPGSAMFNFGDASGKAEGFFLGRYGNAWAKAGGLRPVRPQAWQKSVPSAAAARKALKNSLLLAGDSLAAANSAAKREGKKALCAEAKRRFPNLKVTMQNCDALLIADYGKTLLQSTNNV